MKRSKAVEEGEKVDVNMVPSEPRRVSTTRVSGTVYQKNVTRNTLV